MTPQVDSISSDSELPDTTDVVVIGGGIIGVATALTLAERGIAVVLCEKGIIAGEQSCRNWGWVRQQGRDHRELPLMVESTRLWEAMDARVGCATGFVQCGVVYLEETEQDVSARETWLEHARPYGVDSRIISAAEANELLPGSTKHWAGALYTRSDGRAEPSIAAPAMARAAQAKGAIILENTAVRGIETTTGAVSTVVTEKGSVKCSSVVLAGGMWSGLFCKSIGLTLPQLGVISSVLRTRPIPDGPELSASAPGVSFRKRLDGGYSIAETRGPTIVEIVPNSFRFGKIFLPLAWLARAHLRPRLSRRFLDEWQQSRRWSLDGISPFETTRILDPEPLSGALDRARKNLAETFPFFNQLEVAESWAGLIDATPDAIPVISAVDALPGLFLATGFSGHGFGIGPAAGQLAADLVTGNTPLVDPTPFRFSRFSDGTPIRPVVAP